MTNSNFKTHSPIEGRMAVTEAGVVGYRGAQEGGDAVRRHTIIVNRRKKLKGSIS
jgi:hypothetical protein